MAVALRCQNHAMFYFRIQTSRASRRRTHSKTFATPGEFATWSNAAASSIVRVCASSACD